MLDPLTRSVQPFKWRRKRKPLSQEIKSTYKTLLVTLLVLGVSSTGAFLYTNSLKPAKGYTLKEMQLDYESLQSDQRRLERKLTEAQSFLYLEKNDQVQNMQEAEKTDLSYLNGNSGLAQNKVED